MSVGCLWHVPQEFLFGYRDHWLVSKKELSALVSYLAFSPGLRNVLLSLFLAIVGLEPSCLLQPVLILQEHIQVGDIPESSSRIFGRAFSLTSIAIDEDFGI